MLIPTTLNILDVCEINGPSLLAEPYRYGKYILF